MYRIYCKDWLTWSWRLAGPKSEGEPAGGDPGGGLPLVLQLYSDLEPEKNNVLGKIWRQSATEFSLAQGKSLFILFRSSPD